MEVENSHQVTATGDRDNSYVGEFPSQRGGRLQTILIGHENVQNDQVGRGQPILLESLLPITRFRDVLSGLL